MSSMSRGRTRSAGLMRTAADSMIPKTPERPQTEETAAADTMSSRICSQRPRTTGSIRCTANTSARLLDILNRNGVSLENQTGPSLNMEETERAAATSPLNKLVPKISTESVKQLVLSYWREVEELYSANQDPRAVLSEMFLEIISNISQQILESLKNSILDEKAVSPLLVSEEAVTNAVRKSLTDSFVAALGFGCRRQIPSDLFTLVGSEVTHSVNSVLCSSQLDHRQILMPDDNNYSPPKVKINTMVQRARNMRRYIQENFWGCMRQSPQEEDSSLVEEQNQPTPKRPQPFKQQLGSCFPCRSRLPSAEEQEVTIESVERHTPSVEQNTPTQDEDESPAVSVSKSAKKSASDCQRVYSLLQEALKEADVEIQPSKVSGSVQTPSPTEEKENADQSSDQSWNMRFQNKPTSGSQSQHKGSHGTESEGTPTRSTKRRSLRALCPLSCCARPERGTDTVSVCSTESLRKTNSPAVRSATEEVAQILLDEAKQLSTEDVKSLSTSPKEPAPLSPELQESVLVREFSTGTPVHKVTVSSGSVQTPSHTVKQKEEKAPSSDQTSGMRLQNKPPSGTQSQHNRSHGTESTHTQKRSTKRRSLRALCPLSCCARPEKDTDTLSACCTESLSRSNSPTVKSTTEEVAQILLEEAKQLSTADVKSLSTPPKEPAPHSPQLQEPVLVRELQTEAPVLTPSENTLPPEQTPLEHRGSERRAPLPFQWGSDDLSGLVLEVVSKIFRKKWCSENDEMVSLSKHLMQKLKEQLSEWDIQAKPSSYKKVAEAVYKDLCRGTKKSTVTICAVVDSTDYRAKILDHIRWNLEVPQKRTLGSRLRSVCSFFCWPF